MIARAESTKQDIPLRIIRNNKDTQEQSEDITLRNKLADYHTDHEGHAEAVNFIYGKVLRYNESLGWMYWNGEYWEKNKQAAKGAVVETLRLREKGSGYKGNREYAANRSNVDGILSMLERHTQVATDQFDFLDDHLPTKNGIINLRTGELLEHNPEKGFTFNATVEYDPNADYTEWESHLLRAVDGDTKQLKALQIFSGYMLTGETKEEKLLYLYGPTRSGKGTFTETLQSLLPDPIALETNFRTFTAKRDEDTNNFDMAALGTARMVFASEPQRYQALNGAMLKIATGGNQITAAFKGKDSFRFKPTFKICLSSNFELNADVDDDAIWGRIIPVSFPNSHLGSEDTSLKERFLSEEMRKGVLRWAVEGAVEYYRDGLLVPESVKKNLQEQRDKLDTIAQWLEECTVGEQEAFTTHAEAMHSYTSWCQTNGVKPKEGRSFSLILEKKGFKRGKQMAPEFKPYPYGGNEPGKRKQQRGIIGLRVL